MNDTGRPRYAAASTRTRMSGRSGSGPSHAARVSAKSRGVHCGGTGENAAIGRSAGLEQRAPRRRRAAPAARVVELRRHRRESQAAVRACRASPSACRCPICGGSIGVTCSASCRGTRSRGLVRYQKRNAGGRSFASTSQRCGLSSMRAIQGMYGAYGSESPVPCRRAARCSRASRGSARRDRRAPPAACRAAPVRASVVARRQRRRTRSARPRPTRRPPAPATGHASVSPAAASMSGDGVSPAASAAASGSPPGSAAATVERRRRPLLRILRRGSAGSRARSPDRDRARSTTASSPCRCRAAASDRRASSRRRRGGR